MSEELKTDFYNLINEQIDKLTNGMAINTDIQLYKDLKRLAELNVLQIHSTEPEYVHEENTIKAMQHIGLVFTGEDTIMKQVKKIDKLKAENEALKDCLRKLTKSGLKEKIEARIKAQELLNQTKEI